jgi:hypothetical protein
MYICIALASSGAKELGESLSERYEMGAAEHSA